LETCYPEFADEETLAARAVADRRAFAPLYERYFGRVYNYVRIRCPDAQTADDLTAQVFERALSKIHTFCPQTAPFGAWLFGIAHNALGDHFRAQRRHTWLPLARAETVRAPQDSPEDRVIHSEMKDQLLSAMQTLSDRERDLVGLKFMGGLNNRRIAELCGLQESNVGVIIYRALQRLRQAMGPQPHSIEEGSHERA